MPSLPVFSLDGTCLAEWRWGVDALAAYKLNVFAYTKPIFILPAEYRPGDRVLVETDRAWGSVHLRDWSLAGIEPGSVMYVFPDREGDKPEIPVPLDPVITTLDGEGLRALRTFVTRDGPLWYIHKPGQASQLSSILDELASQGYVADLQLTTEKGGLQIVRYEPPTH